MSKTKEWKVGDCCYLYPQSNQEKENPEIYKRLPWIITRTEGSDPTTLFLTNLLTKEEVSRRSDTDYLEECPEEVFISHAQEFVQELESEIEKDKRSLQLKTASYLKLKHFFQELGIFRKVWK